MTLLDLSHPIEDGMAAYPGLPRPRVFTILGHDESRDRYEGRAEFRLGGVEVAGNTGTYLDAPFHRFREREDLAALPLERVVGLPGVILDARESERAVSLEGADEGSFGGCAASCGWGGRAVGDRRILVGCAVPYRGCCGASSRRGSGARRGRFRKRR
jgi:hypothetical protein